MGDTVFPKTMSFSVDKDKIKDEVQGTKKDELNVNKVPSMSDHGEERSQQRVLQ